MVSIFNRPGMIINLKYVKVVITIINRYCRVLGEEILLITKATLDRIAKLIIDKRSNFLTAINYCSLLVRIVIFDFIKRYYILVKYNSKKNTITISTISTIVIILCFNVLSFLALTEYIFYPIVMTINAVINNLLTTKSNLRFDH